MYKFEKSIAINRPQQEVFDFMSDPTKQALYQSSTESAEWTSEGPPGVGATFKAVAKLMGRTIEAEIVITDWDSPNKVGQKASGGPVPFETTTEFETQGDGTLVTLKGQAELGGFFKLAEGLVGKQLEKTMEHDLAKLKELLEAG